MGSPSDNVSHPIGVMLMTFGSVTTPEEVPDYLARIRGGKPTPEAVVTEMQRRYRAIGGSPLLRASIGFTYHCEEDFPMCVPDPLRPNPTPGLSTLRSHTRAGSDAIRRDRCRTARQRTGGSQLCLRGCRSERTMPLGQSRPTLRRIP